MQNDKVINWFELQKKKMKPMGPIKKFLFKRLFPDVSIEGVIVR